VRKFIITGVAFAATFVSSAWAATLSFDQSSVTVGPGQSFSLSVTVTGVSDLADYQFNVGFDPTILNISSVTEGPFLSTAGATVFIPGTISNVLGQVTSIANGLQGGGPGATGSGTLVTLGFTAIGSGTSSVALSGVTLLDSNLAGIAVQTTNSQATVTGTPEPSSAFLVGSAITLWLAVKRLAVRGSRQ
jgi:hypothetical protein